jgi:hypothetical protein
LAQLRLWNLPGWLVFLQPLLIYLANIRPPGNTAYNSDQASGPSQYSFAGRSWNLFLNFASNEIRQYLIRTLRNCLVNHICEFFFCKIEEGHKILLKEKFPWNVSEIFVSYWADFTNQSRNLQQKILTEK